MVISYAPSAERMSTFAILRPLQTSRPSKHCRAYTVLASRRAADFSRNCSLQRHQHRSFQHRAPQCIGTVDQASDTRCDLPGFFTLGSSAVCIRSPAVCEISAASSSCCACRNDARSADEVYEVTVRKPLGITLVEGANGCVEVEEVPSCGVLLATIFAQGRHSIRGAGANPELVLAHARTILDRTPTVPNNAHR